MHVGGFCGLVLLGLLVVTLLEGCAASGAAYPLRDNVFLSPPAPGATLRPVWEGVTGPDWWTPELTRTPFPTATPTRTPTVWPSPTGRAPTPHPIPSRTPAPRVVPLDLPLTYHDWRTK
jgi:hypothetical protein